MSTATEEPLSLAAAAKAHFQPAPPPREVKPEPAKPAPAAKEATPAKPANKPSPTPKPATVEKPEKPASEKPSSEPEPATTPKSEEDAVFGTEPKPAKTDKPETATVQSDEEFEAKLAADTKGMPERSAEKFRELRLSEKAAREEARIAREELKAAAAAHQSAKIDDTNPKLEVLTQENADLKAQLAEAEKVLSVTQIERTQKYRREVSEPMNDLTKQADEIAARYNVEPKLVMAALSADAKERADLIAELASDFKEADRLDLYQIARDMDRLRKKGDGLREKAKSDMSALELEDKEAEEKALAEVRQAFSGSAQRTWMESAKTLDFLRDNPAAPEWTAALATARTQAANYVPGQDAIADGRMIAQATQQPFLIRALEHHKSKLATITEERDRLLERIASDNAHDPGLTVNRDEDVVSGEDEEDGLSLGEGAKRFVAKNGV